MKNASLSKTLSRPANRLLAIVGFLIALPAVGCGHANDGTSVSEAGSCGTRTGQRGLTHRSVTAAGLQRTYLVYLPETLSATKEVPFVYVFHGYTMSGQDMYDMTGYAALADMNGFAVVFPDGEGGPDSLLPPWNVVNPGQEVCGDVDLVIADGNDFAFMDAMKADVLEDQCLDSAHIFSSGFSMGAYFTHHVGCYRSDVRAVAPHSGGTLADLSVCTTGHVPAIIFHGTADEVIDDACDDPTVPSDPGFPASATLWAKKNGCENTYSVMPDVGSGGGQREVLPLRRVPGGRAGRALYLREHGPLLGGRHLGGVRRKRLPVVRKRYGAAVELLPALRLVNVAGYASLLSFIRRGRDAKNLLRRVLSGRVVVGEWGVGDGKVLRRLGECSREQPRGPRYFVTGT